MAKKRPGLTLIVDELLRQGFTIDEVRREIGRRRTKLEASRSPSAARGRNGKKHIAPKASALEIQQAVGVTAADRALVRKVMGELGFDEPSDRATLGPPRSGSRAQTSTKK